MRHPSGSGLPGITPSNAYKCLEGNYVLIAGNGDAIFKRLMNLIGRVDMAENPALEHNDGRSKHAKEIDEAIGAWTGARVRKDVLEKLDAERVSAGYPYTEEDILKDPHYLVRGMIETIALPGGSMLKVPGVLPKLSATPGKVGGGGPSLGEHTAEVLSELAIDEAVRSQILRSLKR